jgi:farnesyl-diphosphate farnesyltransferase
VFADQGFDLDNLTAGPADPAFHAGLRRLVGVARRHLENALTYTLLIPKSEPGIRRFCIWAIGMAVLTLRNIHRRPSFTSGDQVKISRASVYATTFLSSLIGRHNALHRLVFRLATFGLPR